MGHSTDLVLVAVDGSDRSQTAARYGIEVAARYGADVHLLHFVDHRIMQGLETGDVPPEDLADAQRETTAAAREYLPDGVGFTHSAVAGFSTSKLGQTPGSVILDVADELDADFLVVPREVPSGDPDEVLGKSALHVLEYASQPVLSV